MKKQTQLVVTIGNHNMALYQGGEGRYGIGADQFPEPEIGYRYRVLITKLGPDPGMKPEQHAFIPDSKFGGWIRTERLATEIREAKKAARLSPNKGRAWWKRRLKKLLQDQSSYKQAVIAHRRALAKWRRDLKR